MVRWYESSPGNISAGRIIYMLVSSLGALIAITAMVGWFLGIAGAPQIIASGLGVSGISSIAKSFQTSRETNK